MPEANIALLEGQLAWLVYIYGAVVKGRLSTAAADAQEAVDGDLAARAFGLLRLCDEGLHTGRCVRACVRAPPCTTPRCSSSSCLPARILRARRGQPSSLLAASRLSCSVQAAAQALWSIKQVAAAHQTCHAA